MTKKKTKAMWQLLISLVERVEDLEMQHGPAPARRTQAPPRYSALLGELAAELEAAKREAKTQQQNVLELSDCHSNCAEIEIGESIFVSFDTDGNGNITPRLVDNEGEDLPVVFDATNLIAHLRKEEISKGRMTDQQIQALQTEHDEQKKIITKQDEKIAVLKGMKA